MKERRNVELKTKLSKLGSANIETSLLDNAVLVNAQQK